MAVPEQPEGHCRCCSKRAPYTWVRWAGPVATVIYRIIRANWL
ncbi:hypothetical protein GA0115257_110342 [Streptomyces sp. LcepLS]|nr:hypothetical protein GA0115257_110342 [Streptomyces sp. LcepLS]